MKLAYIAFSDKGFALAEKLAEALGGTAYRSGQPQKVNEWTEEQFTADDRPDGIVYVGAAGIAVRAIAPFVTDKAQDPAVIVIDECAYHVIPILSGHLGGANDLARQIASVTGSDCVITTATDVNGVFAVDEWAKRQNCKLIEREKIVNVSSALLAGKTITFFSRWPIEGDVPEGIELIAPAEEGDGMPGYSMEDLAVIVDLDAKAGHPLHLVPQICILGIGCRKGTTCDTLNERLDLFLEETGIHPAAIRAAATIDIKKDEPGLIEFCEMHGWPLLTYTSEELKQIPGTFTSSKFVSSVTGVDNVCERSAVAATGGKLLQEKMAGDGVTMALAMKAYRPNWTWRDEPA